MDSKPVKVTVDSLVNMWEGKLLCCRNDSKVLMNDGADGDREEPSCICASQTEHFCLSESIKRQVKARPRQTLKCKRW